MPWRRLGRLQRRPAAHGLANRCHRRWRERPRRFVHLRGCMPSKTLLWSARCCTSPKRVARSAAYSARLGDLKALHARRKDHCEFANDRIVNSNPENTTFIEPGAFRGSPHRRTRRRHGSARETVYRRHGSRVSVPPVPGMAETPFGRATTYSTSSAHPKALSSWAAASWPANGAVP